MGKKSAIDLYSEPELAIVDGNCAIEKKYEDMYYNTFPNDPEVILDAETGGTDSKTMLRMWLWALEHRRHWYEWPDLVSSWAGTSRWMGILPPDDL